MASSAASKPLFDKILVANRGEIACRVMKSCRNLGIKSVAVYSDADEFSKHVSLADEAVRIGPPPSSQSYLMIDRIVEACKQTGAQAVHPGYGFLSENRLFAKRLAEEGIVFIGPDTHAIEAMGDKIESKKLASAAGVNVIPGFQGEVRDEEHVKQIANEIGYPVMIKASAGGGGKGIRIAWNDKEALEGYRLSKVEAKASFGDDRMLIEKFVDQPRHIEIQVLGDRHGNTVYLPERECSIQRRNQKVVEEAPSTYLTSEVRKAMGEQAVRMARAVDYVSAGTVEMLVDSQRNFYFLEMNTRLQVEHPVTEYITGVDLVEEMIRVAAGLPLSFKQEDVKIHGWAMESRVYAEDPYRNFLPSIGNLRTYVEPFPGDPEIRVDSGVRQGSEISVFYDPMICKLVTHGVDRASAVQNMRNALDAYIIRGVNHNIPFLRAILENPRFLSGNFTTQFIAQEYPDGFVDIQMTPEQKNGLLLSSVLAERLYLEQRRKIPTQLETAPPLGTQTFLVSLPGEEPVTISISASDPELTLMDGMHGFNCTLSTSSEEPPQSFLVMSNWPPGQVIMNGMVVRLGSDPAAPEQGFDDDDSDSEDNDIVDEDVLQVTLQVERGPEGYSMRYLGTEFHVLVDTVAESAVRKYMPEKVKVDSSRNLLSPMPGSVVSINVKPGDTVIVGQELAVVEAMKMQNVLHAERDCKVKTVEVSPGDSVAVEEILMTFELLD